MRFSLHHLAFACHAAESVLLLASHQYPGVAPLAHGLGLLGVLILVPTLRRGRRRTAPEEDDPPDEGEASG